MSTVDPQLAGSEVLPELAPESQVNPSLAAEAIVWRVGEIFGEFGCRPTAGEHQRDDNPLGISRWRLQVSTDAHVTVIDETYPAAAALSKVVKLKASTAYLVRACLYSDKLAAWGPWSPMKHTRTFPPVITSVAELGEDYVRLLWDRQLRDASLIDPEQNPESMEIVSHISQFQLRVVREVDMQQEVHEEFPVGVRTYTLHDLRPATAYIVFVRYATLIHTLKQWSEVCRFVTQAAHSLEVVARGETTFGIAWERATLPESVGYLTPDPTIHKFELTVDGGRLLPEPIELPPATRSHTFVDLDPSTEYKVRFRCLTKEGRWTSKTKPVVVRTAAMPEAKVLHVGETFVVVAWDRDPPEEETKVQLEISSSNRNYNRVVEADIDPQRTEKRYDLGGLVAGTSYEVRLRTFVQGCWGRFSHKASFRTCEKPVVRLTERGENFLNVSWNRTDANAENKWRIVVRQIKQDGREPVVLDAETTQHENLRLEDLDSHSAYRIVVRAWQVNPVSGDASWGEESISVVGHTLRSIALQVVDIGEDFAQLTWTRDLVDAPSVAGENRVIEWGDLKYEIKLSCFDAGEDDQIHKEVLDTTYTVTNLLPDTVYHVSVRACDERKQWGEWRSLKFRTLATVVLAMHDIGEDYARVMWRRAEEAGTVQSDDDDDAQNSFVSQFSLFIFSVDEGGAAVECSDAGYHRGGNSEIRVLRRIASQHQSYRIDGLLPDREYVAVLRAATASDKWGLWSKEVQFRTVAPFRIPARELNIGENYVSLVWSRDEDPVVRPGTLLGDYAIIAQEVKVVGINNDYYREVKMPADARELKQADLQPATAYSIQIRVCNSSGEWGLWSSAVQVLTRATIVTRALEVAEDYLVISWERSKAPNPHNYPTGKGFISSYRLRITDKDGNKIEESLSDADCPYRTPSLQPDSFYLVELKANYNDEEWGQWSVPLWCRTMTRLSVRTPLISEEFCHVAVSRPLQSHKIPSDAGFDGFDYKMHNVVPGERRETVAICVTAPVTGKAPHATGASKPARVRNAGGQRVPEECADERLIVEVEVTDKAGELKFTVPNLKADTVYTVSARSKRANGDWGMWSDPNRFITLSPVRISFTSIGEDHLQVDWRRAPQDSVAAVVNKGVGYIARSRIKVRELSGAWSETREIESSDTQTIFDKLKDATTYAVSVQTLNDNHDWGAWSEESRVRTMATMGIDVEHIGEDAVWLSWMRKGDLDADISSDTALSVDTQVRSYQLTVSTPNGDFSVQRDIEREGSKAGGNCFLRGLVPDTIYDVKVRAQSKSQRWGKWSSKLFRTLPTMRVSFGNIGEHFAVVEWRRHLPTSARPTTGEEIVEAVDTIELFRLKVQMGDDKPVVYELPPNMSSFRLNDLLPSSEYRMWLCARGREGVWGLWNEETRVRTLPQLQLSTEDIGENYVTVSWRRMSWSGGPKAEGEIKTWEIDGAVSGYQIRVLNDEGETVAEQMLGYTQQRCTLPRLDTRTVYTVMVRAKDTYNVWGLWSEPRKFVTLYPVATRLMMIGEDFIQLEWDRKNKLRDRLQAARAASASSSVMSASESMGASDVAEDEAPQDLPVDGHGMDEADDELDLDNFEDYVELEPDVQLGKEDVLKWQVRLYTSRLFGGQPEAEDYQEFFPEPGTVQFVIPDLVPANNYTFAVRAQNTKGEWGQWSNHVTLQTLPLIQPTLQYVGEDFISLAWQRNDTSVVRSCFPPANAPVHNYKVSIAPLAAELHQFSPSDGQPFVDGVRVYETSQPSLKLVSLMPGTRYRVEVQEQKIDVAGELTQEFGVPSETVVVETIEPMTVEPEQITENSAVISWHRLHRDRDAAGNAHSAIRSGAKISNFEVEVFRMDDQAVNKVPNALSIRQQYPASTQQCSLPSLSPNCIYGVTVRAQTTDGGGSFWGKWCGTVRFITQKKLVLCSDLINEDNAVLSWSRALPDWATGHDEEVSSTEDGDSSPAEDTARDSSLLSSVIRGEYTVQRYELTIRGIGHDFEDVMDLQPDRLSHCVAGLRSNTLYAASVRALSNFGAWSVPSAEVSLCTLKPIELSVSKHGENFVQVSWHRPQQDIQEHTAILERTLTVLEREHDRRDKELAVRMQKLQERQELEDGEDEVSAAQLLSELAVERDGLREDLAERATHLRPEHVAMGRTDVGAFHVRIFGDAGMPYIDGSAHLLDTRRQRKKKGPASNAVSPARAAATAKPRRSRVAQVANDAALATEETVVAKADEDDVDESMLLDARVNHKTNTITFLGLEPLAEYHIDIRGRNALGEWGPWSSRESVTTLELVTLQQARIGEQYAHLYWHRLDAATLEEHSREAAAVAQWEERIKSCSPEELEAMKRDPEQRVELRKWRQRARALSKRDAELQDGQGQVVVADNTTIRGYFLRVVHLPIDSSGTAMPTNTSDGRLNGKGQFTDFYFEADAPRSFTVTKLQSNCLYAASVCVDYGDGQWGAWTAPVKFMTQNLMQLAINYVSESFVDLEWRRAPNRRLPRGEEGVAQVSPTTVGRDNQYEVSVQWVDADGARQDDRREVRGSSFFRVNNLLPDTKYELCVREKDNRGQWGLWSASKACFTLPSMAVAIGDVGEDWLTMSWRRQETVDKRAHTETSYALAARGAQGDEVPVVELPVAEMAFYLRVVELDDNGTVEDLERLDAERAEQGSPSAAHTPRPLSAGATHDDLDGLEEVQAAPQLNPGSPLPPSPAPIECEPRPGVRYEFVRKFDYETKAFRLDDLRPDRFYAVQVLCETTGGQIGNWSSDLVVLTLRTISCNVALVDEESARIAWQREAPRTHPRLSNIPVVTGSYKCAEYEVEGFGITSPFKYSRRFHATESECRIDKMSMASAYGVRVRSTDTEGRVSRWSESLHFATLTRMRVIPDTLTESFAWVEWGREPASEDAHPTLEPPLHVPSDRSVSYHLRVHAAGDRALALVDKQFQGSTTRFQLHGLQPNTAYSVQVRACNPMGEWGQWSTERVIYTMKLIEAHVQAVGEDYIVVAWNRDAPDERPEMVRIEQAAPAASQRLDDDDDEAPSVRKEFITQRQYPLLDRPEQDRLLYRSDRTRITKLRINVQMHGDGDSTTVDTFDDGESKESKIYFPVTGLRPNCQYFVSVCACYGTDEDWGLYSEAVATCTLNTLAMNVKYVGENYISALWARQQNSFDMQGLQLGRQESTLCYEFVLHDFTGVASGADHTANLDQLVVHTVKTKEKSQLLTDLQPNRRYRLAVRRWYRPVQQGSSASDASVNVNGEDIEKELELNQAQPGHWSEAVFALTLRRMVVTADDIAEDFMRVQWERDPMAPALSTRQVVKVHTVVTNYHIKIDELGHDGRETNESGSMHFEKHYGDETTAFRFEQLTPDTAYRIVVRCCTDKTWGDWSEPCVVVTLPKIQVSVNSIGEDYISVSWHRNIRTLTLPDGKVALNGNTNNLEKYQLEMFGLEHPYHLEKKFRATRTSYRIKCLEAQTVYALVVRSCDSTNTWSMWSDRVTIVTLKQLHVSFGKVGEQFAHVSWSRDPQSEDEYHTHGKVHLGDPTVKAYHLVLFPLDYSPTTAVLDKQFSGDTTHYRVTDLNPANSYIAIVRACNNDGETGQWGLWSEEKVVTTLPLIQLQILSIGENYVTVRWSRDDVQDDDGPTGNQNHGIRVEPTMYRIGVTGERASLEKTFTPEDAVVENDTPTFTVRKLAPDTSYVVSMHACYGDDEWGLWTVPITFLTPNKLGIIVSNVSETRAEFTWGRGQQSPQHAHDPNVLVWQPNVVRYQLVLRRLEKYRELEEKRARQQAAEAAAAEDEAAAATSPTDGAAAEDPLDDNDDEVRVMEREMDHKHSKYMQTFCVADNLLVNTDYHVQVRALDDRAEWGEWTDLVFDTPPMPPGRPTLKKQGNSTLVFTWDPPDATGQYLYLVEHSVVKEKKAQGKAAKDTGSDVAWAPLPAVDEPTVKIKPTGPLNKVRVRVKCCKVDRPVHLWSQFTQPVALASQQPPQPVPAVTVVSTSRTSALVEWARSPSAPAEPSDRPQPPSAKIQYKVMYAARDHAMVVATTTRSLSHELTDLTPNTAYRVQVVVENDAGVASHPNVIQRFTTRSEADKGRNAPGSAGRPGTSDGKLPALQRGSSTQTARSDRVDVGYTPRPPAEPSTARTNRPHPPTPTSKRAPSKPSSKPSSRRPSRGSDGTLTRGDTPPQTNQQQRTAPLPPVERRGPPPQGSTEADVSTYNVVGFDPSEDGDAQNEN